LRKEKGLIDQLKESESKNKRLEKKYEHQKKQMKDIENKIIDKDAKLKFMEMQKKNEDLASKLEYDFP
jgi:hypothetical protein